MISIVNYLFEMNVMLPSEIKEKMSTYRPTLADKTRQEYLLKQKANQEKQLMKNTMR
jgi:hypothetical protein